MIANCPICSRPTDIILTRALRRGFGLVYKCATCDLGFLVKESERDLEEYYASEYRKQASHHADGRATDATEIFAAYRKYQGDRIRVIDTYLTASSRVLEIGASAGQFLHHLGGRCARRCAIELDPECREFMHAMGIETDDRVLSESRFAQEQFDIVCAFQVMEHTDNPVKFLEDIKSVMAPHAHALIEVPNLRDPLLSVWDVKEYVPFYFHQDHLFYFTEQSMGVVARQAGLRVIACEYLQDYNLLNHLHWVMNRRPQDTNEIGMSMIDLKGKDTFVTDWLTASLRDLNERYIRMLQLSGSTSNFMVILT